MKEKSNNNEELNHDANQEAAIVPQGEDEGLIRVECEELEAIPVESEDHSLAIPSGFSGFKARLDALIPLLGDAATAVPGKDAAIVRFPVVDGKQLGWNDLLNRKTPGWEEWKQLGGFRKDGKFNPQAAIKKAGLKSNPAAVANLALQGAAIVVGQAYMTEINSKLEGIESGIAAIERMLERDKEAEIDGIFRKLKQYTTDLEDNSADPIKLQAVINNLESMSTAALQLWSYQISSLNDFKQELSKNGRLNEKETRAAIAKLRTLEETSASTFQLAMLVEQTSMQYDNDFSSKRVSKLKASASDMLEEYQSAHDDICRKLSAKVDKVKGLSPVAVAKKRELKESPKNPVDGAVKHVGEFIDRHTPIAVLKEGKKRNEDKKRGLYREISKDGSMPSTVVAQISQLDSLDFMFNGANALLITEDEIRFIADADTDSSEHE